MSQSLWVITDIYWFIANQKENEADFIRQLLKKAGKAYAHLLVIQRRLSTGFKNKPFIKTAPEEKNP